MKDYLRPQKQQVKGKALRSLENPNGRDRKNRLERNFDEDVSIRVGRKTIGVTNDNSWCPHDYL